MLKTWMKDFENKLLNKKMQEKMSTSFSMVIRLMIACLIVAIVGLTYVSSKLKTFYQSSYNNVALAHSSYGNLQEGAKNLLHACLISDPEIVESRLELSDTYFSISLYVSKIHFLIKNRTGYLFFQCHFNDVMYDNQQSPILFYFVSPK